MAYVKLKDKSDRPGDFYVARSFYRSNSHGIWRYIPDYMMNNWDEVTTYGKGFDAKSLNLPFGVQMALTEIRELEHDKIIEIETK